MAVITVSETDTGDNITNWAIPPGIQDTTFVPRGIRTYRGSKPIAAKLAADQTSVQISFTFPTAYAYLIKSFSFAILSDDTSNDFQNEALVEQYIFGTATGDQKVMGNLTCPGISVRGAVNAHKVYLPQPHFPRPILVGGKAMQIVTQLADISADASTAGDVQWFCEFFEFDNQQIHKWPVNSPQPVFCY